MATLRIPYSKLSIEHDPDENGFSKGVRFSEEEISAMLKNCSFTDGTILKDISTNNLFVVNRADWQQKIQPLSA